MTAGTVRVPSQRAPGALVMIKLLWLSIAATVLATGCAAPDDGKSAPPRPAAAAQRDEPVPPPVAVAPVPPPVPAPFSDAFRICLVLIDPRSGKLIAKRIDRATLATVDAEPTSLFRDAPTWALDRTALAYVKSCQGSSPGDNVDPGYLLRLPAAAIVNEAAMAFADNKTAEAYKLFHEAQPIADPDDLRVLNGLYMTSWRTGRKKEAADTFGKIVGLGIDARSLPIKFFFNPGRTTLMQSSDLRSQYAVWLRELAVQLGARESCLKIVGHTSRTGGAAANVVLSQKRASLVKQTLERQDGKLTQRLTADGVGSSETIIGLGTDDLRDALDRRVEFRTVDCAAG